MGHCLRPLIRFCGANFGVDQKEGVFVDPKNGIASSGCLERIDSLLFLRNPLVLLLFNLFDFLKQLLFLGVIVRF